jgi:cobyrinic acid a,c-diamide synthase
VNLAYIASKEDDMNTEYVWTPSGTDVTIKWRHMGWIPPSETPSIRAKWKYYQELPMRHLTVAERQEYENVMRQAKVQRIK